VARQYKLQWLSASRRWRKQYKGKQYYFPLLDGETKASSHYRCLQEWEAKKVEIDRDSQATTEPWLVSLLQGMQEDHRKNQDSARYVAATETLRLVRFAASNGVELPVDEDGNIIAATQLPAGVLAARQHLDLYQDGLLNALKASLGSPIPQHLPWETIEEQPIERTVGALLDRFQESNLRVRQRIKTLRRWCDECQDASEINSVYCRRYYDYIVEQVEQGKWTAGYGKVLFAAFTQFVRWLYKEVEILDRLPRNLDDLRIEAPNRQVEVFDIRDVKRYVEAADGRLELYLLLMLNCGMTQIDISDLHPAEVDWDRGRVIRKRSKTKKREGAPVCTYFLWPRTLELLKGFRSGDPKRVLLTKRGTSVATRSNGSNRTDSVQKTYQRFLRQLGEQGKPLRTFKKTSASLINSEFGLDVAQLFLGHAPRSIAQKHYIVEDDHRLEKPLRWLAGQYGL